MGQVEKNEDDRGIQTCASPERQIRELEELIDVLKIATKEVTSSQKKLYRLLQKLQQSARKEDRDRTPDETA